MDEHRERSRLKGKRALVTGAGTGIGRAVGLHLAQAGAAVAFHYAHAGEGAAAAAETVRRAGGRAAAFSADFTDVDAVRALAREAGAFLGGLDILVNNAGITMNQPFEQVTVAEFDTLYQVNVKAMFFLTQAALPALLASQSAAVINMTSIHAFGGTPEYSVYAGTKGAIASFTRQLGVELAPRGVRVNAVAPGAVEVDNYYLADPRFDAEALACRIPAGFLGQPSDVAHLVAFLASDDARYIVGQTFVIDGGTTAWFGFNEDFRRPVTGVWGKGYVPGR